jgi:hypothetical protein
VAMGLPDNTHAHRGFLWIHVQGSAQAMFSSMDEGALTAYAAGLLAEYLPMHWAQRLREAVGAAGGDDAAAAAERHAHPPPSTSQENAAQPAKKPRVGGGLWMRVSGYVRACVGGGCPAPVLLARHLQHWVAPFPPSPPPCNKTPTHPPHTTHPTPHITPAAGPQGGCPPEGSGDPPGHEERKAGQGGCGDEEAERILREERVG